MLLKTAPAIAQTELIYSTYFGGSIVTSSDRAAIDEVGNLYILGQTEGVEITGFPDHYPIGAGRAIDDIFVTKFNPEGYPVLTTVIGGTGNDNTGPLTVAPYGEIFVLGSSDSQDFPVTADALDATCGGPGALCSTHPINRDVFLLNLAGDGQPTRLGAVFVEVLIDIKPGGNVGYRLIEANVQELRRTASTGEASWC